MREVSMSELKAVAGGVEFGYGRIPGFYDDNFSRNGPYGMTLDHSFGNGWSLSAGFARGARGVEIRYVWK